MKGAVQIPEHTRSFPSLFQNPLKVAVVHNFYRAGQFSLNISEVHLVYAILKCNCKFA